MKSMRAPGTHKAIWMTSGIGVLLIGWALLASGQLEYVLPGPASTGEAMAMLLGRSEFWVALGQTLTRAIAGLTTAFVLGLVWGLAIGKWQRLEWFSLPILQLLLSTPAIIFVILAMIWLGTRPSAAIMVVAAVTMPLLTVATRDAFRAIDPQLTEMAQAYRFSPWHKLWHLHLPSIMPPVLSALTVAMGQSLRLSVMTELLATTTGLGAQLRLAQINIETPQVFAYALLLAGVTFALELGLLAPMRRFVLVRRAH